jgi:hypothetical protein
VVRIEIPSRHAEDGRASSFALAVRGSGELDAEDVRQGAGGSVTVDVR